MVCADSLRKPTCSTSCFARRVFRAHEASEKDASTDLLWRARSPTSRFSRDASEGLEDNTIVVIDLFDDLSAHGIHYWRSAQKSNVSS